MAIDLNKAIAVGCWNQYTKLKKDPKPRLSKSSSGKEIVVLKNLKDETIYFYADGTWVNITKYSALSDEDKKKFVKKRWQCDTAKLESDAATAAATAAATKLSQEQDTYMNTLVNEYGLAKSDGSPSFKEKIEQGLYTPIDLNSDKVYGKPELFKEPNKFFIYKKKGITQEKDKQSLIDKWTGGSAGYKVVDCNSSDTDNFAGPIVDLKERYPNVFLESFCVVQKIDFTISPNDWNTFLSGNVETMNDTQSNPSKKLCRKVINNYYQAMDKQFAVENSVHIETAKNFIRQCDQKLNFSFGTKNNLQMIMGSTKKRKGKYGLRESTLSTIIKKNLNEVKENKNNLLVEKQIINNRFNLIFESFSSNNKIDRNKLFMLMLRESYLLRQSGMNEQLIVESENNLLSMMFSAFGGGILGAFKEQFASWIIKNTFGEEAKNSIIAQWLITGLGNINSWSELVGLATDCQTLTNFIVESFLEGFARRYQERKGYGGVVMDTLRNTILDSITSSDVVEALKKKFMPTVCSKISNLKDKMDDVYGELKQKMIA